MSLDALTTEDKKKLKHVVEEGIKITQEIEDLKGGLKDTVKAVAEAINIKPKDINRAIRVAFKEKLAEDKEALDNVEEILHVIGKA